MKKFSFLISRYVALTILPYFVISWLLLSVILFVQQGSRFADVFFNANIPGNLIWQLSLALVPNVIAFTCPMAVLIGVVIGLSRMQTDNELIAIRAAGTGNLQITFPLIILGVFLSAFTLLINIYGVPYAARIVRNVALQTALYKLESPIEPGVFNTEINGYTIYVKDGDLQKGTWKNIFIYYEDAANKTTRLITSKEGRIDSKGDASELVLSNALVSTISAKMERENLISENVEQIRFSIPTKRGEIVQKLGGSDESPEELGLNELSRFAEKKTGREKIEAEILWQRRLILSINPLLFALLGAALIIRFNRGGQGFGMFLALVALVFHYLLTLFGEQLARTNQISVLAAGAIPFGGTLAVIGWLLLSKRIRFRRSLNFRNFASKAVFLPEILKFETRRFNVSPRRRILDFDITLNLLKYFLLAFGFLTAIYLIFTAFELWKFAGEIDGGFFVLIRYLFFLLPFIYIQLAPSVLMIAMLATFIVKSRQNEIVTWTSAGQSIYRLLLPCFALMILAGCINWQFQEKVLPQANRIQDELRSYIRSRGSAKAGNEKYWIAEGERIFSFEQGKESNAANRSVKNLSIYEFSENYSALQRIYKSDDAVWEKAGIKFSESATETAWDNGKVTVRAVPNLELTQGANPFINFYQKPNHLTAAEIKNLAETTDSETMRRSYEVALQKKYATAFLPFVIALFTLPFALSLNRKGRIVTVGYAVGLWLLFTGLTSVFEQFGLNDFISPEFAVWSPILLFGILGAYLLSKIKT